MNTTLKTLALATWVIAPIAACGDSTSTGSGGSSSQTTGAGVTTTTATSGTSATSGTTTGVGGGATAQKACADEAAAICTLRESCSPGFDVKKTYGSAAVCETRTAEVCVAALAEPGTGNTVAHTEACAAAYPSETCPDLFDGNPVAACVPAMGTLATGAPCAAAGQCTSGYCALTPTTVCGTCQPLPVVGATCLTEAECGRDLACATPATATSGKCAAWVASSGPCLSGVAPCANGLACVGDAPATATMGTCQAQGTTVGAACDGSRKTAPNCDGSLGLVCIPTAQGSAIGTCQNITLVATSATCGDIGAMPVTGFAACDNGGQCKKAMASNKTGTCVAPAADGASCDNDPTVGPPCLAPAKCVIPSGSPGTAGKCTLPDSVTCM